MIAWLAKLRVKVAIDGSDIDRRGCRTAHCSRVRLCRRAWRRRYSAGAGGRNCAAVRRAIPPAAAATAPAAAGETASPALNDLGRPFFLHLTFRNTRLGGPGQSRGPNGNTDASRTVSPHMGLTIDAPDATSRIRNDGLAGCRPLPCVGGNDRADSPEILKGDPALRATTNRIALQSTYASATARRAPIVSAASW